ncbi:hypothetical protein [Streptomyces sp. CC228A]|uniref:hypothetical protein n=1 Tax=Streptomyces sp. CC228A TaxID=2898186 RepID=UPI001F276473|nr:hypothetical protein [Streptomyces sp. CC228A]
MTEAEGAPRTASARDAARFGAVVVAPALAAGLVLRRRTGMALAERYAADRRAVRLLGELRRRYGPGPLRVDLAGRRFAVLLDAADAQAVLAGTPDPYAPSTVENRAALERFQPHGVLVSRGDERAARRTLDETALETGNQLHSLAPRMLRAVREEAGLLLAGVSASEGELRWDRFSGAWAAAVRRLVLGDGARDDTALTAMLGRLRTAADRPPASPAGPACGTPSTVVCAPTWSGRRRAASPPRSPRRRRPPAPTPSGRCRTGCPGSTRRASPPTGRSPCSPPTPRRPRRCATSSPSRT